MYIVLAPNYFHVGDFRNTGDRNYITITGRSVDPVNAPGGMVLPDWTNDEPLPADLEYSADFRRTAAEWLISEAGPYAGGAIYSDEEYLFEVHRLTLRAKVKAKRDAVEQGGLLTPHGRLDTDAVSQRKILGAFADAVACLLQDEEFSETWRLADDTYVTLDAPTMIAVGRLVKAHVSACQARKNALDALIEAAETLEDLGVLDIESGWPD